MTFSWLPDDHTVVALYPGYSGCAGPAACLPVPIAPAPAAWTLDTSTVSRAWKPVPDLNSAVAGMFLIGPGPAPSTVVAQRPGKADRVTVLDLDSGLAPGSRSVTLAGSCDSVDRSGVNLICTSGEGIVATSLDTSHMRVIGPAGLTTYGLTWS